MNKIAGSQSFRRRLLANMPEDVASSFTELQLTMIEQAVEGDRWRQHPVDIRVSVPAFWKRFYIVLLAGPERRSRERRNRERAKRPLTTITNAILFALFLTLLIPATIGIIDVISIVWAIR